MDEDKAVAAVTEKLTKTDLARAALMLVRDMRDWRFIAMLSLLLNIWLAYLAGVL
jgi:hypothetical protein